MNIADTNINTTEIQPEDRAQHIRDNLRRAIADRRLATGTKL